MKIRKSGVSRSVFGLLTGLAMVACDSRRGTAEPPGAGEVAREVAVVDATVGSSEQRRTWVAVIEPLRVLSLTASRQGRVTRLATAEGARVRRGEPILELAFPDLQARQRELSARVGLLAEESERWRSLVESGAVSDADGAKARLDHLLAAEALGEVEALLAEGLVSAPSDGTVIGLAVAEGSQVHQESLLGQVADGDSAGVRLRVAQPELRYFQDPATLRIETEEGKSHAVERIVTRSDPLSGDGIVELWIDATAAELWSNATVRHAVEWRGILVPWTAVAVDSGQAWVAEVDPAYGTVRRRAVSTGRSSGGSIEIVEGLEPGAVLLRHEPRSVAEGVVVRPTSHRGERAE